MRGPVRGASQFRCAAIGWGTISAADRPGGADGTRVETDEVSPAPAPFLTSVDLPVSYRERGEEVGER